MSVELNLVTVDCCHRCVVCCALHSAQLHYCLSALLCFAMLCLFEFLPGLCLGLQLTALAAGCDNLVIQSWLFVIGFTCWGIVWGIIFFQPGVPPEGHEGGHVITLFCDGCQPQD